MSFCKRELTEQTAEMQLTESTTERIESQQLEEDDEQPESGELREERMMEIETTSSQVRARDLSQEESLVGAWFFQYPDDEIPSFMLRDMSYVFYADGTGSSITTEIVCLSSVDTLSMDPNTILDHTEPFSWSLNGNIVTTVFEAPYRVGRNYRFDESEQQLHALRPDGSVDEWLGVRETYTRERVMPEGFAELHVMLPQVERTALARKNRFIGTWYWDVTTWTFNQDGTGVIDVPAHGGHPADQREFTFFVIDPLDREESDAVISLEFEHYDGVYVYHATFGPQSGGSVTLRGRPDRDPLLLTRWFDLNNTPVTSYILEQGLALFDMFSTFM